MKSVTVRKAVIIVALLCGATALRAQGGAVSVPSVAISGFVDTYYSKNFAHPVTAKNQLRNFDVAENQFNLSLVELVFQKKAEPVGFRLDLDYGSANDMVQPGVTSSLSIVQQAYLTVVVPIGKGLTVDAGKFVTHMGNEVIESKDNWNYSRSLLFAWAIPYYHTGVRLSYPLADNLAACVHVVNGWNSGTDNNDFKTIGATLNWTAGPSTSVILNAIDGFENLTPIESGKRTVYDLIVTQKLSDVVTLAVNADYGQARTDLGLAIWKGAALYAKYAISEKAAFAVRGEIFDDPQGYATGLGVQGLNVKEFTATYEYLAASSLLLRGELRHDASNAPVFDKNAPGTEKTQTTVLVGAVVSF
ncbi:MAG TPA: porin [Bacteroidota bacterium]|nr:porin [Bacteroidota bacterium]